MALNEIQQLNHLLQNSKHVLLVLNTTPTVDAIAGALALERFLEKQHKQAEIVVESYGTPRNLRFLKGSDHIQTNLSHLQKFIIKVDLSNIKIDTLSYDIKDNWLSIYLTPKQGIITKNELRTAQTSFKYDLIITVGAQDLESLGAIFFNNTDLFYRMPIVNFDNHSSNEHFGQLNFVELTATSACEIIFKTLNQLGESLIDEELATALLTGMISQTQSFKTTTVTPATLNIASQLMNLGADREKIVQHLYKTRSIASLKLWGQALTHMENDAATGLVWTTLTREDFSRSGAQHDDLKDLIDELISSSPEAKIIALLYEDAQAPDRIHGFVWADKQYDAKLLTQPFHSHGNKKAASFVTSGKSLKAVEDELIVIVKKIAQTAS